MTCFSKRVNYAHPSEVTRDAPWQLDKRAKYSELNCLINSSRAAGHADDALLNAGEVADGRMCSGFTFQLNALSNERMCDSAMAQFRYHSRQSVRWRGHRQVRVTYCTLKSGLRTLSNV